MGKRKSTVTGSLKRSCLLLLLAFIVMFTPLAEMRIGNTTLGVLNGVTEVEAATMVRSFNFTTPRYVGAKNVRYSDYFRVNAGDIIMFTGKTTITDLQFGIVSTSANVKKTVILNGEFTTALVVIKPGQYRLCFANNSRKGGTFSGAVYVARP